MQQFKLNKQRKLLKSTTLFLAVMLPALILVSFKTAKFSEEIWKQLGLTKNDANSSISTSFLEGYFSYYAAKNAKNIATGNRAAVVKELGAYAKTYINSESFRKEYEQLRESRKPVLPRAAKSIDEVRAEQKQSLEKSIREMEQMLKLDNPDIRKAAKDGLAFLQKQYAEMSDPGSKMIKLMADGEKLTYETNMTNYKESLAKWEKEMPANYQGFVKNRLQQFLEQTAGIDFTAELKEHNGKKRFVNPAYQAKSPEWKQAFRAGKEATEAARNFAGQWINEIK
jgi:hypothetical protein